MSGNADFVIPTAVKAGLNALKTCAKTPSIKRVVLTSSSIASTMPSLGVEKVLDQTSYNEEGLAAGLKHPEGEPEEKKGLFAYAAQKTATEKACWKWVEERKPGFVFNTVLPNCNFGTVLVPEKQGWPTTVGWCKEVFEGSQRFGFLSHALEPRKPPTSPSNSYYKLTLFFFRMVYFESRLRSPSRRCSDLLGCLL
jgi:nucleoside-diphosphate-sugar epimerase